VSRDIEDKREYELIYISGWQGGARQVVVATFRLVSKIQGAGASFQLVLKIQRGCILLLVVARRKSGSWRFHPVDVGKDREVVTPSSCS
jgi:hypothetical protein